ncbi:hypothetical protein ACLB1S_22225 [Escherichia coli]
MGISRSLKDGFLLNIPELPEKPAPEPNLPQEIAQSISNIRDWYFAKDALLQQRHQIAIDEVEAAEQRKQQKEEARARCKQAIANMLERANMQEPPQQVKILVNQGTASQVLNIVHDARFLHCFIDRLRHFFCFPSSAILVITPPPEAGIFLSAVSRAHPAIPHQNAPPAI